MRLGRALGWDAVPGNNYELLREGEGVVVKGSGKGHGVGLCPIGRRLDGQAGVQLPGDSHSLLPEHFIGNREQLM